jgi:hypothetical protein
LIVGHLLKKSYIYSKKIELRKLIAMPSDLESSIRFLEETNDPTEAFFSYTVDDTGEFGLIKANKEGLRLYAAELLRKSQTLEQQNEEKPLFFPHNPWMYSETGYDLIAGVLPEYHSRREILGESPVPPLRATRTRRRQPVGLFVLMCITGALIMLATLKAFPTLRLWVNIH